MTELAWRDAYLVGVEEIDGQHRQLFILLAGLDAALAVNSPADLSAAVTGLIDYLKEHFDREEALLGGHPDWPAHHLLHWRFTAQVLGFLRDFKRAGGPESRRLAAEIRDFLLLWLKNHILETDQRFFSSLPHPPAT